MAWLQMLIFCGGLLYAAAVDLKTRTVNDAVCIVIALAGLINISPASFIGAFFAMLPFYICAGLGRAGGGDWRLAAAIGFVLGTDRVVAGFYFMLISLLVTAALTKVIPTLKKKASVKLPLVPFFALAFIPAYFI